MASGSLTAKKPKAATKDRISELPDIILHSILCSLPTAMEAGRTIALSRRWGSLWRKFSEITIERFNRDSLLRIKILNLSLTMRYKDSLVSYPLLVEQLFNLASQRKAEEITLWIFYLPLRLVSISSLKILRLQGITLMCSNLPLSFNSLRSLLMYYHLELEDERILSSLIASSPLLETLEIGSIHDLSKLELSSSNVANMKTFGISDCNKLEEIEIEAPRLHTLRLTTTRTQNAVLNKIRLTAPELHHLEISGKFLRLKLNDVVALLSKLQSLKTLIFGGTFSPDENTLRLSVPKLEELTLINLCRLVEIEIDGGPNLMKFSLKYDRFVCDKLKVCKINHAAACRWELHSGSRDHSVIHYTMQQFVKLKKFLIRFPQFRTLYIDGSRFFEIDTEVSNSRSPIAIEYLIINAVHLSWSYELQYTILDGLFLACRPKYISFYKHFSAEISLQQFSFEYLSTKNSEQGIKGRFNWQHMLKDVKIATEEEKEEELINVPKI